MDVAQECADRRLARPAGRARRRRGDGRRQWLCDSGAIRRPRRNRYGPFRVCRRRPPGSSQLHVLDNQAGDAGGIDSRCLLNVDRIFFDDYR